MFETIIEAIAIQNNLDSEYLHNKWKESEQIAKEMGKEKHYGYVLGVFKNILGLKEISLSAEEITELFLESEGQDISTYVEDLISSDIPPSSRPEIPYKGTISTGKGEEEQDKKDNEEKIT